MFSLLVNSKVLVFRCKGDVCSIRGILPKDINPSNLSILSAWSSVPRIVVIDRSRTFPAVNTYICNMMKSMSMMPYISATAVGGYYTYVYSEPQKPCFVIAATNFGMANAMLSEFLKENSEYGVSKGDYGEAMEITNRDARVNHIFYQ